MDKKVLFVDDERVILQTLTVVFKTMGFQPFSTTDPHKAIEMVTEENIQVGFLDLRMPEIDGMELCRMIRKVSPNAWIYALSAYVERFDAREFTDAGFAGRFKKPFKIDQLKDGADRAFESIEKGLSPFPPVD